MDLPLGAQIKNTVHEVKHTDFSTKKKFMTQQKVMLTVF